ncbi:MAG: GGDEF domain-containing protein [Spirochaetaceae bacterium]|nr:GGDEF domain-containing protein [Spirochaetaceae bacterium]
MIKINKKPLRIGLLIHNIESTFSDSIINYTAEACKIYGAELVVLPLREINGNFGKFTYQFWKLYPLITDKNIDALVVMANTQCHHIGPENFAKRIKALGEFPIVSVGTDLPEIPSIITDNRSGFAELITHLIEKHKCRRIALLSAKNISQESIDLIQFFKDILAKHNVPFYEDLVFYGNFSYLSGYQCFSDYHSKEDLNFDAVVSLNDDMAQGCIHYFSSIGINVPDNVIVTGYDDIAIETNNLMELSTVNQRLLTQLKLAVDYAYQMNEGKSVPKLTKIKTILHLRHSCGCNNTQDISSVRHKLIMEPLDLRYQINCLRYFEDGLNAEITLNQLQKTLKQSLLQFDIKEFCLCLYPSPIYIDQDITFIPPEEVTVFMGFNENKHIEIPPNKKFDPRKQLYPDELFNDGEHTAIFMPLYHEHIQFGYFLVSKGSFFSIIYEMFQSTFSRIFASAYAFTDRNEELKSLQKLNRNLEEQNLTLNTISLTDEMTGIFNRRGLVRYASTKIQNATQNKRTGLVIYGDMDGLKKINDTFGHDVGDEAILAETEIFQRVFRETDIIARIGGDEFVVVAFDMKKSNIKSIRTRLDKACEKWNEETSLPFKMSISIGACEFNEANNELETLLVKADTNLYKAKRKRHRNLAGIGQLMKS